MRKVNNPPIRISNGDIIFAKINGKIKKCIILSIYPFEVMIKKEKVIHYHPCCIEKYDLHKWKYGTEWALTRKELERCK